jgi:hypothetical protein
MSARDYAALESIAHREGREVLVVSTRFVYRSVHGRWLFVRREPAY